MKLEITRLEGQRNDLLLRIERSEIDTALLSVANRRALMALPGMPRHRSATAAEEQGIARARSRSRSTCGGSGSQTGPEGARAGP